MNDIGGVWRTVGGRRIFIKDGQDLASAMQESGKFNNNFKNDIKEKEKEINEIQDRINKIKTKVFLNDEDEKQFNELNNKKAQLQKERLDLLAKNDKNIIQDKDLRDFIYDYTNGEYRIACSYTQRLAHGMTEKDAFKETNYYENSGINKLSENDFKNKIELSNKLLNEIDSQKPTQKILTRIEKHNTDFGNKQTTFSVGQELDWGIRSTSSNEDFFNKVVSGQDKLSESSIMGNSYAYTEYKIVGEKKGLNIAKYSEYPDQDEVLIHGKFIVEKVENFKPNIVYDDKRITFKEYLKNNNFSYEKRISKKSGKEIIEIKDNQGKTVRNESVKVFEERTNSKIEDILSGKNPYLIEKIENKEKSTYGVARQIVTMRKK